METQKFIYDDSDFSPPLPGCHFSRWVLFQIVFITVLFARSQEIEEEMAMELRYSDRKYVHSYAWDDDHFDPYRGLQEQFTLIWSIIERTFFFLSRMLNIIKSLSYVIWKPLQTFACMFYFLIITVFCGHTLVLRPHFCKFFFLSLFLSFPFFLRLGLVLHFIL